MVEPDAKATYIPASHEDMMVEALDNFMSMEEQTPDQLLNSFTFLKREDVENMENRRHLSRTSVSESPHRLTPTQIINRHGQTASVQIISRKIVDVEPSEDMEQTIVADVASTRDAGKPKEAGSIKIGNFVVQSDMISKAPRGSRATSSSSYDQHTTVEPLVLSPTSDTAADSDATVAGSETSKPQAAAAVSETSASARKESLLPGGSGRKSGVASIELYPGEVENIPEQSETKTNDTQLSTFAHPKRKQLVEGDVVREYYEETRVESFSLDPEFDYDHCPSTPKYTSDDMNVIKGIRKN